MARAWFLFQALVVGMLGLCSSPIYADWHVSESQRISDLSESSTHQPVFSACQWVTGQFLSVWSDDSHHYPTYSIYTPGDGWSEVATITTASQVKASVAAVYEPISERFFASWTDAATNYPMYAFYTLEEGWSEPQAISMASFAFADIYLCANGTSGELLATWSDSDHDHYPTYARYMPGTGWGLASQISSSSHAQNVTSAYNSKSDEFIALWVDTESGHPVYSLNASGSWSTYSALSTSTSVAHDLFADFIPATGQYLATWSDANHSLHPAFSFYTPGLGWSAQEVLSEDSQVVHNIRVYSDPLNGQLFAFWVDVHTGCPTCSIYTPPIGWSVGILFSTTTISEGDITAALDPLSGSFLTSWADATDSNFLPSFALFTNLSPPSSISARIVRNQYLGQTDIVYEVSWTPPEDSSSITGYLIKKNGQLVARVSAGAPCIYYDHNRREGEEAIYQVVSITARHQQSSPSVVFLP